MSRLSLSSQFLINRITTKKIFPQEQREKYGLMTADKYFYLNQGGAVAIDGKSDAEDFEAVQSAMQV